MKIHHIGLIVKDIKKNINIYEKLNYQQISEVRIDECQNNKICFLKSQDSSQVLELIEPISENSSIYHFQEGYHHICYEIDNDEFISNFSKLKIGKIFTKPVCAPAIDFRRVLFGCLTNGTFVEFLLK